ncbi:MAG: hypothetical protein ACE5NG_20535 [bacterium]
MHHLGERDTYGQPRAVDLAPDGNLCVGFETGVLQSYKGITHQKQPSRLSPVKVLKVCAEPATGGQFRRFMIDRNNQLWCYSQTTENGVMQFDLSTMKLRHYYTKDAYR